MERREARKSGLADRSALASKPRGPATRKPRHYDVIIIGAGLAGLTAARKLLKSRPEISLLVVEAKDRVGGRLLSKPVRCADGQSRPWCFGGAWVARSQRHLLELLGDLGVETFDQCRQGIKFVEMNANVTQYEGGVPTIGLLNLLDLDMTLRSLERQAVGLKDCSAEQVSRMDQESVRDAVQRLTFRQESEIFLRGVVAPVLQGSDDRMSQIHALKVAQSSGGFEKLFKDAQELRIDGGAQRVAELLAKALGQGRLRLGWPVVKVTQVEATTAAAAGVHLVSEAGERLECSLLLCTLPLAGLQTIRFSPQLPPKKARLAASCPVASLTLKTVVTYAEAFWSAAGFSGEILSCRGQQASSSSLSDKDKDKDKDNNNKDKEVEGTGSGPISVCYDGTTRDGAHPALVVVASSDADHGASLETRREATLNHLARFYPREQVYNYVDYVEHSWQAEPRHTTCMATPVPAGCGSLLLDPELAQPFGRIHFAGSDLATKWIGYMEGAVQSGLQAAEDLMQAM